MRVAPTVVLSPEERAQLYRWSRRDPARDYHSLRARVVLRAAEGRQDLEIAQELGLHRLTVSRWRHRFLATRLRGIGRRSLQGPRPGRVPEDRIRAIVRAAVARNPRNNRPWSTRALAKSLGVSHSTVRRMWDAYGLRPSNFGTWPARPDPRLPRAPADVVGVYLRPPDRAIAFILDPATADRLERSPVLPPIGGFSEKFQLMLNDYRPEFPGTPARELGFLRFLGELSARQIPDRELRVLAAVPGLVGSRSLERWRARHPKIQFEFVADRAGWSERLGRHLRAIGRRAPGPGRFRPRGELVRAIRLFLDSYVAGSGPFEWVATETEVARDEAGFRLRHALSVTGHTGFKKPTAVQLRMRAPSEPDSRVREMARVILRKSLRVKKGERVTIESWTETLDFANALVLESLRLGARPLLLYQDEPTYWAAASEVRPSDLARVGDHLKAALRRSDVFVSFFGPSDRERFHALPRPVFDRLCESQDAVYEAVEKSGARAVSIALGRASEASARMYGVDLERWRNELIDATLVAPDDLHRRASRVVGLLQRGRRLTIRHANGTELTLNLKHRRPLISDGRAFRMPAHGHRDLVQLPAGVVQVALDEKFAEGEFVSNVPNSVGVMNAVGEVVNGRWTFQGGKLTRYHYDQGEEIFAQSYDAAGPGRERPGILSVGLNDRIEISPLLMDQGTGTVTLQLGRNDYAGGVTRTYWWAWLLLRGADLTVDGSPLLKAGKIVE